MTSPTRRLDDLGISEVSGVDHPAHLSEGWMVLKAATDLTDAEIAAVLEEADALAKAKGAFTSATSSGTNYSGSAGQTPTTKPAVNTTDGGYDDNDADNSFADGDDANGDKIMSPGDNAGKGADVNTERRSSTQKGVAMSDDEVLKSLPEPVRKRLLEAEAMATTAITELAKERDLRLDREAITKARDNWSAIPGLTPEDFGPTFRKMAEKDPAGAAELEKVLTAANTALKQGNLFREVGKSAAVGSGVGTTAYDQIESIAKVKVDSGECKTMPEAIAKAATENPNLYLEYEAEKKAGVI